MREIIFAVCLLMMTVSSSGESDNLFMKDAGRDIPALQAAGENADTAADGLTVSEKPTFIWDDLYSEELEYTDLNGVNTDVCLFCLNDNGKYCYRLGFVSDDDAYQYCKIESLNGILQHNVIEKFETVQYWLDLSQNKENTFTDLLSIKYYDADGNVLRMQEKYVYFDELSNVLYTIN